MKKALFFIGICVFFLSGCSAQMKKPSEKIKSISATELIAKSNSTNNFSFVITLKDCPLCNKFFTLIDNNSSISIDYEVNLDKNDKDYKTDLNLLYDTFPEIEATPEIFIKKGNKFTRYPDEIDDNKLTKWFNENN